MDNQTFSVQLSFDAQMDWDSAIVMAVIRKTVIDIWRLQLTLAGGSTEVENKDITVGRVQINAEAEGIPMIVHMDMVEVSGPATFLDPPDTLPIDPSPADLAEWNARHQKP
jgi:hypothetical protein